METVENLEGRALLTIAATSPLPDVTFKAGADVAPVNLDAHFQDTDTARNFAMFDTSLGTIPVLLTPATTPKTVANFLDYVNKGDYTNTIVHRSVPGFVWQTGGYQLTSKPSIAAIPSDPPVANEFGASNTRGTIAMAKLGNDPNSATNQFFFNESDSNAANLDNQNGGFTVFGRVVGDQGLAVMDAVANVPVPSASPLSSPLDDAPLQGYTAGTAIAPSNLVLIKSVSTASELFLPSSSNPAVATASVQGSTLTVTPLGVGTSQITVVGYGSDGKTASDTFTVTVEPTATLADPPASTLISTTKATTTPSTPTSTPTTTTRPSALTPALASAGPAGLVVAGQKLRTAPVVTLRSAAGATEQGSRVRLVLSTSTAGSSSDMTIAAARAKVPLKAGGQTRLKLNPGRVSADAAAGTYHVLLTVTDADGGRTTVDTGRTLTVRQAGSKATTK